MNWRMFVLKLTVAATVLAEGPASGDEKLSPTQAYQAERTDAVVYDIDYSVIVTPPYKTKLLRVWLPIPPSDFGQEFSASRIETFPAEVRPQIGDEPLYGNRFAYFEFANPQGGQIIRHRFRMKVWELRWNVDEKRIAMPKSWPSTFDVYRRNEENAVAVTDGHLALAKMLKPNSGIVQGELADVMEYTRRTFRYDHQIASLRGDSRHLLERKQGHCSDYHSFCAAVGRAMGYPTRITYGLSTFAKASPSHCKLEAFLPPYGWVSFDVSETQKLTTAIEADNAISGEDKARLTAAALRRRDSGFRDNCWFLQTRGSDYDLAPPAGRRVPVVRTIYAEADGKPLADPDPSNPNQREFAWMTAMKIHADREVEYPFANYRSLDSAFER